MSPRPPTPPVVRLDMLRRMLRARIFEEEVATRYGEQEMRCPVHLGTGQEAVAAGVCAALGAGDTVWSNHRSHVHAIARGVGLEPIAAELYGRATGCSAGKGGSMHLVGVEAGFPGTSAIVGGAVGLSLGAAMAARMRGRGDVAAVFFGDGAADEGIVHESMTFAAVQGLPLLFVCENNLYATCSPVSARQPADSLVPRARALGIPADRIDGNDAVAVFEAAVDAIARARAAAGPTLLECMTYRWHGHVGPGDDAQLGYRPIDELARWMERCPIEIETRRLLAAGAIDERSLSEMRAEVTAEVRSALDRARGAAEARAETVLADVYAPAGTVTGPWVATALRPPTPPEPPDPAAVRRLTYREALKEAQETALELDPRVFVYGVGAADSAGVFGSSLGLAERFGPVRAMDSPLAEGALTALGAGAAIAGMRPVLVHLRMDFILLSLDALANHAAKWRYMFGGKVSAPIVIRCVVGRGWGAAAQHSQSLQALVAHIPGIRVAMPATPYDAKGLFLAAIAGEDPTVLVEHKLLYDVEGPVPEGAYLLPMGKAACRRSGRDATVVATSWMVEEALRAAKALAEKGIDVEVLDLRTVKPLDREAVLESVSRTGRLVVADTGWGAFGVAAEVAAIAAEGAFDRLRAPVRRVALPDAPTPAARALETAYYPGPAEIAAAVEELVGQPRPRPARRKTAEPLPPVEVPKSVNYVAAFLTLACNLGCSFCINRYEKGRWAKEKLDARGWARGLNRLVTRPDLPVTIQGGEPSLHPGFYEILEALRPDLPVDLLTNLELDVGEFMRRVPPERLKRDAPYASIRVSYHPEVMRLEPLKLKVVTLLERGYSVGIWGVLHPAWRAEIEQAQEECRRAGIDFRTKEFLGRHDGRLWGTYRYEGATSLEPGPPVLCRSSEIFVGPGGSLFRCHSDLYEGRSPVGHILDPDLDPRPAARRCDSFGFCNPCDVKVKTNRFQIFGHTSVEIRALDGAEMLASRSLCAGEHSLRP